MWSLLKSKIWQWRSVLITVPSTTVIVILLRFSGLLQILELAALDQLFILRPSESRDERIVIVEIDEEAVRTLGKKKKYPIPDAELATILENLKQHQPRGIGLDIYRDIPVGKGNDSLLKVFESTPNLVGVQKVAESIDSSGVNPPPALKQRQQVGANDLPLDGDGKIRRTFFYLRDEKIKDNLFSFSFKLAYLYLNDIGIEVGQTENLLIKVGKVVFTPFESNDGGYVRAPDQGYQVLINYRGDIEKFQKISVIDVLENRIPSYLIKGRIVLIGTTASSLKDIFSTPYSSSIFTNPRRMAGVIIHANAISQILSAELGDRPLIKTWNQQLEWLWISFWSLIGAMLVWQLRSVKRRIIPVSILFAVSILLGISYITFIYGWWIPLVPSILGLVGSAIGVTAYLAESAGRIRQTFGRYLNDEVVANLLESPEGLKLGGQRRNITIFTSDLRGFTATSERLPAEEVIKIINLYLGYMADIITDYQGTIDEFMGDGILVLFGAPTVRKDDATRAIACAVAMQQAMEPINQKMKEMGLPKLEMGIGINTGEVVVGNIGSEKRTKYGIVGKQVNLTYRIESYTIGGQIFISESTLKQADPIVKIIGELEVKPKGVQQPITIYEVGGIAGDYNLYLHKEEEVFFSLSEEIPFEYSVLDGKDISDRLQIGKLIQLSENAALVEINSDEVISIPKTLTNIKINLLVLINNAPKSGDIYAKILEKQVEKPANNNIFYIRFTNKPPEVEVYLDSIYKSIKKE